MPPDSLAACLLKRRPQYVYYPEHTVPEMQKQLAKVDGAFFHGFDCGKLIIKQTIATDEL